MHGNGLKRLAAVSLVALVAAAPALAGPLEDRLINAINDGNVTAVHELLQQGADATVRVSDGRSLADYAWDFATIACWDADCVDSYLAIVDLLKQAGSQASR